MDSNKLPVRMQVFPGNTSDSITYLPMIKSLKNKYGYDRIISVADKGMNSTNNISYIHFNGDGYVFSQILKGKKGKRYHEKMFEDGEFIYNEDRTYKYRIFEEDFQYVHIEDLIKIQNIFGGQLIHANIKQENLNKYIKSIKFAITK